jgi:uncharacterized protein YceK
MRRKISVLLLVVSATIISGCGSGIKSSSQDSPKSLVSGKVADGYLVGATVFMDKNSNYKLDAGEPTAITDANGAYTLNVDPADVGKYPIVAMAIKGVTVDKDTGAAVQSTYILSMPAKAVFGAVSSNFISPISSQLREMMETGKYTTMQQAMSGLSLKLGMPAETNMMADYMAANNSTMHTAARNMATLMGSQMAQVVSSSGATPAVDVNRYRGMMGTIFSNMSSVKGSSPTNQANISDLMGTMTTTLSSMPVMSAGQSFMNMSSAFRGSMMGGTKNSSIGSGGMM